MARGQRAATGAAVGRHRARASPCTSSGRSSSSTTAGRWCRGPRSTAAAAPRLWEWLIFEEEYYRAGGPQRVTQNGIFLLAPTIFEFGTAGAEGPLPARAWPPPTTCGARAGASPTPAPTSPASRAAPPATTTRGGWRAHRPEDLDHPWRVLQLAVRPVPHRPRGRPPQRHDLPHGAARRRRRHRARRRAPRRRRGLRRGLLRRRVRRPTTSCSAGSTRAGAWPWPPRRPSGASPCARPGRFCAAADRLVDSGRAAALAAGDLAASARRPVAARRRRPVVDGGRGLPPRHPRRRHRHGRGSLAGRPLQPQQDLLVRARRAPPRDRTAPARARSPS